jgi:hypothetical protein
LVASRPIRPLRCRYVISSGGLALYVISTR